MPPKAPASGSVKFAVPHTPMFVGSYHRIPFQISTRIKFKIKLADLAFSVPAGLKGGLISPSHDPLFNPAKPTIMLCCGYAPGTYTIVATHVPTNTNVGEAKFRVTSLWKDQVNGPSLWFTGQPQNYAMGAAWGGGAAGPQNYNVHPATGTRRIAILMVDTSTERFTNDATAIQSFKDRWMNETINGVTYNGHNFSVRSFYREESNQTFDISAQVFGPVSLPGKWDDYFDSNQAPKGSYWQACITAGDGVVDYTQFDTVVCASQPKKTPLTEAWPYANGGTYTTSNGNVSLGVISLSNEWGLNEVWQIHESLPHELGHNLGLPDLYGPEVTGRMLDSWDLMDWNPPLPYVTLGQRLELGFVKPSWVKAYDFASNNGLPVDETVTLQAVETGQPQAGRFAGIEIRIADGWNYYFEYRKAQGTQEGDQQLPTDNRVLGTDVVAPPWTPPFARPQILLLAPTGGNGAVLDSGQSYQETDFSDPTYPTDFKAEVSNLNGTTADVRIRYGVNGKPDPSIRPWPAGPGRDWQSPDIEVQNMRNQMDASLFNLPWVGHDNTVIASIKNSGSLDAPGVVANFYVKDYTISGAPESFLGSDKHDVNAGATVKFQTNWQPPSEGHFCIVVRIPLYQNPNNPAIVEMTELNNIAQSNYTQFISASASPPSRERALVKVANPYNLPTRAFLRAGHSNPMYRTYLGHTWLKLKANEVRDVELMFEYAPDNLTRPDVSGADKEKLRRFESVPNHATFVALLEDPRDPHHHRIDVIGGADARVLTGRATKFSRFVADGRTVSGTVVTVSDNQPLANGRVLVRVGSGKAPKMTSSYQAATLKNGAFVVRLRGKGEWVDAYCLPSPGFGDCSSRRLKLKT